MIATDINADDDKISQALATVGSTCDNKRKARNKDDDGAGAAPAPKREKKGIKVADGSEAASLPKRNKRGKGGNEDAEQRVLRTRQ